MKNVKSGPRFFISYRTKHADFVAKVCHALMRQARVVPYFDEEHRGAGDFFERIMQEIQKCDYLIFFLADDSESSKYQMEEIAAWLEKGAGRTDNILVVNMGKSRLSAPPQLHHVQRITETDPDDTERAPLKLSEKILKHLDLPAAPFDDLPTKIEEKYEKDIINLYASNKNHLPEQKIRAGYPKKWPAVSNYRSSPDVSDEDYRKENLTDNPLDRKIYGEYRKDDSAINVDARHKDGAEDEFPLTFPLTFPESGPREQILKPPRTLKVAILVSGGIAPGINAVISAIMDRHNIYNDEYEGQRYVEIYGCAEGLRSLCEKGDRMIRLYYDRVKNWTNRGGSFIPTARADQLLNEDPKVKQGLLIEMARTLYKREIRILYVIGGEGSMRAAHAIWTTYEKIYSGEENKLLVLGIPKTMDNDILWVWQSFGFLSAVEKARQYIMQLSTEATSNPRVGVMQLFGSSSGYVVSHAALGSNVCDLALIPELEFTMEDVCKYMCKRLRDRTKSKRQREASSDPYRSPYGLIVMSETAIPTDFEKYMNQDYVGLSEDEKKELVKFAESKRTVLGQTPDALRSAGLKIVSKVLQRYIRGVMGNCKKNACSPDFEMKVPDTREEYWNTFRVFTNEPRHLIRSMEPSVSDVAYGIRLGTMAVDMAMAGYTDCMVSQWLTEYVVVPLKLVVLGRKRVPKEGIFWKTVVAKTGQISVLTLTN